MSDEHHCKGAGGEGHRHGVTCREISDFLLAYVERELDSEARDEFDRHLNHCPPCLHYLDGYRETVELVRRCTRAETGTSETRTTPNSKSACTGTSADKHRPPEGLVQAILAAKRSLERG